MVDAGIVKPGDDERFTEADVRRVGLVQSLEDSGVKLEGLAAAIRRGELTLDFMDTEAYDRFSSLSSTTFEEMSVQTGIPIELLMVVREASGGVLPTPQDRMRENELMVVPFIEMQVAQNFRPLAIERLLRTTGEAVRRIAASEGDWWRSEVLNPRAESGLTTDKAVDPDFTNQISTLAEQAMIAMYHAQQAQAWTRNILDGFEQSLMQAGLHERLDRPSAMCFLDITGYTRMTQEYGDAAAADVAVRLSRLVERTASQHGGRPVKWLGDGVMLWFRDPGPGVIAALEMVDGVVSEGLPPAHVGLHAGPLVMQEGDYYGQTVNVASRVAEYARAGEVLVTQAVVEVASDVAASFSDLGLVDLKGVDAPMRLHAAHRSSMSVSAQ